MTYNYKRVQKLVKEREFNDWFKKNYDGWKIKHYKEKTMDDIFIEVTMLLEKKIKDSNNENNI